MPNEIAANAPKDEWTLQLTVVEGEFLLLAFHKVQVLKILRRADCYLVAKVHVLGPVPGSAGYTNKVPTPIPTLMWKDQPWDTEGTFTPQQM